SCSRPSWITSARSSGAGPGRATARCTRAATGASRATPTAASNDCDEGVVTGAPPLAARHRPADPSRDPSRGGGPRRRARAGVDQPLVGVGALGYAAGLFQGLGSRRSLGLWAASVGLV